MATASTASDIVAEDVRGQQVNEREPEAVALVNTVAARKAAVHPGRPFPAIRPNRTTTPEPMPTRLKTTWIIV